MTGRRAMRLVAERELRETFRRKAFWVSAALVLLASTAGMVVPELVDDDDPVHEIGVVGGSDDLATTLRSVADSADVEVDLRDLPDAAAARQAVEDGEIDLAAVAGESPVVVVEADGSGGAVPVAQLALDLDALSSRLADAGLSGDEAREVLGGADTRVERLDPEESTRQTAAAIVSLALYLLLLMLTIMVANGTATEKANRISEVLLAIVPSRALLFGKVAGVGLSGILVLGGGLVPVAVKAGVGGDLPSGLGPAVVGGLPWLVLGLALYLTVAGTLGALVERQEEAGSAITPLSVLLVAAYLIAAGSADNPLGSVLAYVPLTSPLVMPSRLALGVASPVEIACSLALLVVSLALVVRVGAVLYRRAVVRTGRRLHLRDVLRTT